jgi:hypothetical protein
MIHGISRLITGVLLLILAAGLLSCAPPHTSGQGFVKVNTTVHDVEKLVD